MTAYTARPLNTNALYEPVEQTGHGFVVGNLIIFNGTNYQLAKADTAANAAGTLMVGNVADANSFFVSQEGFITNIIQALTPGDSYYLSATSAGLLDLNRPGVVGEVILECFTAVTASSGYFWGGFGTLIESPTEFNWTTKTTDFTAASNNGYFINAAGNVNVTLPATFAEGDVIQLASINTGTITVLQNAGQSIILGSGGQTTVGVGGSLVGTTTFQGLELIGAVANTVLYCKPPFGTFEAI